MEGRKREHWIEQLSAYLDDELTPAERREMEAFLAGDADVRALLAELRATSEAIHQLPRAKASDRLLEGVRTRLERQALLGDLETTSPSVPPGRRTGLRWIAAAAVIAMAFVTLYMVGPLAHRDRPVITVASAERKPQPHPADKAAHEQVSKDDVVRVDRPLAKGKKGALPPTVPEKAISSPVEPTESRDNLFGTALNVPGSNSQTVQVPAISGKGGHELSPPPSAPGTTGQMSEAASQRKHSYAAVDTDGDGAPDSKGTVGNSLDSKKSYPTQRAQPVAGAPVVATVELTSPDTLSQQRTVEALTQQYAFQETYDHPAPKGGSWNLGEVTAQRRAGEGEGNAGTAKSVGRSAYYSWKSGRESERVEGRASEGRTLTLRRLLPGQAIPNTLQQVQSQWPSARVQMVEFNSSVPGGSVMPALAAANDQVMTNYSLPFGLVVAGRASQAENQQRPSAVNPVARGQSQTQPVAGQAVAQSSNPNSAELALNNQAQPAPVASASRPAVDSLDARPNRRVELGMAAPRQEHFYADTMPASSPAVADRSQAMTMDAVPPAAASAPATGPSEQEGVILIYLRVAPSATQLETPATVPATRP